MAGEQPHVLRGGGGRGREQGEPGCLRSDHGDRGGLRRRFSAGLTNWSTVTRITQDVSIGSSSAPERPGNPTNQSAFAYADLSTTLTAVCVSANVNVSNRTTALDLIRLRTAANGGGREGVPGCSGSADRSIGLRQHSALSGGDLPTGWNRIEISGTGVTTSGTWDLYLNGSRIVNAWAANTGTTPVGRIQIGDTAAKTWTANFDDVIVDNAAG